jgi:hypothetical protein
MLGLKVLHDIPFPNGNIDHILIGPKGIYTIETKARTKSNGNDTITYDGKRLRVAGFAPDRDPITQARKQAHWLHLQIKKHTDLKLFVRPAVVFPGWYINANASNPQVWVLNENGLASFLANEKDVLSADAVDRIYSLILNVARTKRA